MFDLFDIDCPSLEGLDPQEGTVNEGVEDSGFGWGSFALGGILGSIFGSCSSLKRIPDFTACPQPGAYSEDEEEFLKQVRNCERELDLAWEAGDWKRIFLLAHAISTSLNEGWSEFLPEGPSYSPTARFHEDLKQNLMPLLIKTKMVFGLDYGSLLPKEWREELSRGNLSMNYESMIFTLDGEPL